MCLSDELAATSSHVKVRLDTRTLSIPQRTYPLKAPRGRDKFTVHSKAVVCQDVDLKGDITIGAGKSPSNYTDGRVQLEELVGTIVHPKATIFAAGGPIVIGQGCIIEENAIILNRYVSHPRYRGDIS